MKERKSRRKRTSEQGEITSPERRSVLVQSLAEHVETQDFEITAIVKPDDAGLPEPQDRGGFRADIEAKDRNGRMLFGIIVTDEDLSLGNAPESSTENAGEAPGASEADKCTLLSKKIKYFSTLYMRDTKLPTILYIGYPRLSGVPARLKKLYVELGIDWKMKHILFVRIDD